jgi:hypothetical protein
MLFIITTFTLITSISYLDVYLIPAFKIFYFPSQSECCTLPTFPLVVSYSSSLVNLPSQIENGVLLILSLAISSSLPRVSLDIPPFFIVLIPLALICLHRFSYTLVCYRLWPLRYFCLLPKCLPWTYPLKASPLFWESLRVVSYLSLPWFLFTSCRLTIFVLIPSLAVFWFAITLTLPSIDLALILIFIPAS